MSNVSVYSFADASGLTKYVDNVGDFVFTGTWASTGTYAATPLMAVQYGAALYMCIRNNVGDNPQRIVTRFTPPASWSIMSLLYEYSTGTTVTADEAWNLANQAWELAQIGTNTGSAAYTLAGSAYALATQAVSILSTGASGTYSFWVSGTQSGPANVNVTFVNGILVSVV